MKIGEWSHHTSFITPNDIIILDNTHVLSSTIGGLLIYDIENNIYEHINRNKLNFLDINIIIRDIYSNIILGSNSPDGSIQIYNNKNSLLENYFKLDNVEQIIDIELKYPFFFAIYKSQTSYGILNFDYENNKYSYKDYYDNFPVNFSKISDIDIYNDNIILTTPEGIFKGNYINDNLKFSNNWDILDTPTLSFQYFQNNETTIIGGYNNLWFFENDNWNELQLNLDNRLTADFHILDIMEYNDDIIILTTKEMFIIKDLESDNHFSISIPMNSVFTCIDVYQDNIVLGIKNNGILIYDQVLNSYTVHTPNSPIHNQYDAITILDNGDLVGVVNRMELRPYEPNDNIGGITIFNDDVYENFISSKSNNIYEFPLEYNDNNNFIGSIIDYVPGEKDSWSIGANSNTQLIFCNSGINSDKYGVNSNGLDKKGGLIKLDIVDNSIEIFDTTNSILDGLYGIYNSEYTYNYLTINQIYTDKDKNNWIINPYSEKNNTLAAINIYNSDEWLHIISPDDKSYLPQEMTIDEIGLSWFSFQFALKLGTSAIYSEGGLKVLDTKNTLNNTFDDTWLSISNPEVLPNGKNTSIWSIASDAYNRIWILTSNGIQGYLYNRNGNTITLIPLYQENDGDLINFLSFIPFQKGDCIRIDYMNNLWISTQNSGAFLILKNSTPIETHIEYSVETSEILSNKIFDIAFNQKEGNVYFATEKGISIIKLPIEEVKKNERNKIKLSPNPLYIPNGEVQIYNLYPGSKVKILKLNGDLVIELSSNYLGSQDTMILWDGKNINGDYVGSGIYIVTAYHLSGGTSVSKIAVINK